MDEIEKERAKISNITGYQPPDTYLYANKNNGRYKTFNSKKRKQSFGSVTVGPKYGSYNQHKPVGIQNCPTCYEHYICKYCYMDGDKKTKCDCEQDNYECSNGHEWYLDSNGFIQFGRK